MTKTIEQKKKEWKNIEGELVAIAQEQDEAIKCNDLKASQEAWVKLMEYIWQFIEKALKETIEQTRKEAWDDAWGAGYESGYNYPYEKKLCKKK